MPKTILSQLIILSNKRFYVKLHFNLQTKQQTTYLKRVGKTYKQITVRFQKLSTMHKNIATYNIKTYITYKIYHKHVNCIKIL